MWKKYRVAIVTKDARTLEAFTRAHNVKEAYAAFEHFLGDASITSCTVSVVKAEQPAATAAPKPAAPPNPFKEVSTGGDITNPAMVLGTATEAKPGPAKAKRRPKATNGVPADHS